MGGVVYNLTDFVDVLNKKLSLDNFHNQSDKRKSSQWTERMVREFFSKHKLQGVRKGKNVFYTDENIENMRLILILLSATEKERIEASKATGNSVRHLYSSYSDNNNQLESRLNRTMSLVGNVGVHKEKQIDLNEDLCKTISLDRDIKIIYNTTNEELIKKIKKWLNNIGE